MAKVSIVQCSSYEYFKIKEAVGKALDLIGGIKPFIKPGDKVLLKPNLLSAKSPETAIDTHPVVVRVIAEIVKEAGGLPYIGDSPGGYNQGVEKVWEISGMKKVAVQTGARLLKFECFKKIPTNLPGIKEIPISEEALEMDLIISIPKFKTHELMLLTGAVKNMYGLVPGLTKTELHKKALDPESFSRVILKIFSAFKPHLSIMDGVWGIEGDGPGSAGKIRKVGLIMASSDALSLDAIMAVVAGMDPMKLPILSLARKLGLYKSDFGEIELLGEKIEEVKLDKFLLPQSSFRNKMLKFLPKFLVNTLAGSYRVYPAITKKCLQCGICVKSCPVNAIAYRDGRLQIDYKKCILCLCCLELCPHGAVVMKKSLLARVI